MDPIASSPRSLTNVFFRDGDKLFRTYLNIPKRLTARCFSNDLETTEIVVQSDASIVDKDVAGVDFVGRLPNLRGTGHVERQWDHAFIGNCECAASAGIHPLHSSPQGFFNQRFSYTAIGSGHQN